METLMTDPLSRSQPYAGTTLQAQPAQRFATGFTELFRSTMAEGQNGNTSVDRRTSGPPAPGAPVPCYNVVAAWNQVPGRQPSWITGNYPGATWDTYSGSGFLIPYGNVPPGPGSDAYTGANLNVISQHWFKFYSEVDDPATAETIVWGANNPQHLVSAPWLSNNPAPQSTQNYAAGSAVPTQPNYVSPQRFADLTGASGPSQVTHSEANAGLAAAARPTKAPERRTTIAPASDASSSAGSDGGRAAGRATTEPLLAASWRDVRWGSGALSERLTETLLDRKNS
jgi:hypothetical protein